MTIRNKGDMEIAGPLDYCVLKVLINGEKKTRQWNNGCYGSYSVNENNGVLKAVPALGNEENFYKTVKLFELVEFVQNIINAYPEVQALPKPVMYE